MAIKTLLKRKLCVILRKASIFYQDKGTLVVTHLVCFLPILDIYLTCFPFLFLYMVLLEFYKFK